MRTDFIAAYKTRKTSSTQEKKTAAGMQAVIDLNDAMLLRDSKTMRQKFSACPLAGACATHFRDLPIQPTCYWYS
jgi:hypothetical protein